jgi:hypothetical protein
LLGDYYEHGLEHAPPRDPRGVMQRREDFYAPPQDPLALARAQHHGRNDDRLEALLVAWQTNWSKGQPTSDGRIGELQEAAGGSSLDAVWLLQIARSMQFLDGDKVAAAFIHAALAKAEVQFMRTSSGDPVALPLLRQLEQTKALWRLKDYPALGSRFRLARRLYPPLSIDSRRAGYLLADALFYQQRFKEAEATVLAVMDEHRRVGDLGMLDRSDAYEMNYQVGYLQYCAGDLEAAIGSLRLVIGGGEHAQVAAEALLSALLQTGRLNEAQILRENIERRFSPSSVGREALAVEQEEADQLREWRQTASRQSPRGTVGSQTAARLP